MNMKIKVHYIRVSTEGQNTERQKKETKIGYQTYEEKVSGSIAFENRTFGKDILAMAKAGQIEEVYVHSIDRLGRNTIDILNTIKALTECGVNVNSAKEGIQTIVDGKENPIAKMMVGILATLAEFELSRIKERQAEGIAKAKERGIYKVNGGNRQKESIDEYLNKPLTRKILKYHRQGFSIRATAKLAECAVASVQKAVKVFDEVNQK
jgi:DNA invertase Pin-like site-specific DNA recombinase